MEETLVTPMMAAELLDFGGPIIDGQFRLRVAVNMLKDLNGDKVLLDEELSQYESTNRKIIQELYSREMRNVRKNLA